MAKNKDYAKIDTQFESISMAPAPSPSERPGSQRNPGVQRALNTPPTEGKVKTVWYYDPGANTPALEKTVSDRIESHFKAQVEQQVIAYQWSPGSRAGVPSTTMESPMENPLSMSLPPAKVSTYTPTPPGDSMGAGGGQGPGNGATPPGPEMEYGGGQG